MASNYELYPDPSIDIVPSDKEVFNLNMNRAIGDQLEVILSQVCFSGLGLPERRSTATHKILAMVTAMQYVEELPDGQAAEATRTRMDWKYALHLPLYFPGIQPEVLCQFRRELIANPAALQVFQLLLDRLAEAELLGSRGQRQAQAGEVLAAVCSLTLLANLYDRMNQAIEALAAGQTEWLRANAQPYWYQRYRGGSKTSPLPSAKEKQEVMAEEIGADILYLLGAIEQAQRPEIEDLPEVQALRKALRQQFEPGEESPRWRSPSCSFCNGMYLLEDR